MCIIDEHSFRIVEGEGFRLLMRIAEPRWTVPCRKTVASECFKLYDKEKVLMKKLLKNQRLSLTTDCWSSIQNLGYLTLTAHFIDDDWKLQKRILNFSLVENHRGQTIGRIVESCLVDWRFDKIFTITVDNASSNCGAIEYLKYCNWSDPIMSNKYIHVRCAAHIVNLIVKDGLKDQDFSIQRIRNAMKFVRSSPQRNKKFQERVLFEKIECKKGQVVLMHLTIKRMQNSDDLVMKEMTYSMHEKFEKYWVDSTCRNNLLLLGVVFDPRYKFKHVKFMDVKLELEALVGDYVNRLSSSENVASTEMMEMSNSKDGEEFDDEDTMSCLDSQFTMKLQQEQSVETKYELTRYLHEACEKDHHLDILYWWKSNSSRYPIMSKVTKDVLAIPVSTVASEQSF
ncbi:hypothetical protein F511_17827 [Dorcoceras hygrometricum]|uniref:Zinc finger BED domain-containing protein RICESLEEPER 2-like n=1 Tax=Dorcoceras hygrometricum TaxID=472368 RepID=A0A2Z7ABD3_9LAMI|nr:hypothetical protein F511_17827 [Dorcoceras hygrometricum]